jgi:hypothetical protein
MRVANWIKSRRGRRAAIKPPSNTEQSDAALEEALDITDIHLGPIKKGVHDTEPTNASPIEVLHNQHLDCAFHEDFGTGSLSRLKESIEPYLSDPVGVHLVELRCHCFELFKISRKMQIHRELLRRPAFDDAEIIMLGGCCFIADQWISLSFRWSAVHERGVSLVNDTMSLEEPPKLENQDQNVDEKVALFQLDMAQGRRWLETCLHHHQKCRPPDSHFIPHRLLFVGDWRTNPFLVSRVDETVVSYAALSYCWGAAEALVTQTSNVMDHFNGIDFQCLPRVCCCVLHTEEC